MFKIASLPGRSFGNPLSMLGISTRGSHTRIPIKPLGNGMRYNGGVMPKGGGIISEVPAHISTYYRDLLSEIGRDLNASEIRTILNIISDSKYKDRLISFAGGIPDPQTFPVKEIREGINEFLSSPEAAEALQYSATAGIPPLRELLAEMESKEQEIEFTKANILITTGSQQALDLIFTAFLEKGRPLMAGIPIYLGCEQAISKNNGFPLYLATDENGLIPEKVENCIITLRGYESKEDILTLLYLNPTFENPTGITLPYERRKEFNRLAQEHKFLIIEDDPYSALRYRGEKVPSLKSMDQTGNVILLKSFSKTAMPGLRVGYVVADPVIIERLDTVKQAVDLHSSTLSQYAILKYLERGDIWRHVKEDIIPLYSKKMFVMLKALENHFKGKWTSQAKWTKPDGGMFIWVEFPAVPEFNTKKVLSELMEKTETAWVPGSSFLGAPNTVRLNFTKEPEEKIIEGVKRIAKFVEDKCEELSRR